MPYHHQSPEFSLYTRFTLDTHPHCYILLAHETIKQIRPPTTISKLSFGKVWKGGQIFLMNDKAGDV